VASGLDRGVGRACLQIRCQNVDFDEVTISPTGLPAGPQISLADEAGDEHGGRPVENIGG
jgi:hypothetical protein